MSINKYANSKQRRVTAPNFSSMLPSEEVCKRNGHADSNAKKRSRLQQSEKGGERNGKLVDINAGKHNQSRATITMGELILNKKGTENKMGVSKHNSEKTNSVKTLKSSGAKRKLILVDNVDDGEDAMRSQGTYMSFSKIIYLISNYKVQFRIYFSYFLFHDCRCK